MARPKGSKNKIVEDNSATTPNSYKATVIYMGKRYESVGFSILEAIGGLEIKNPKGKSILMIEKGGMKKEKVLMPMQTYRLFSTLGLSREIALKNASMLFQGL